MNKDKNVPVITLDGPSGTGKGTVCHLLAKKLNWNILDSGLIYRALAWAAHNKKISLDNLPALIQLAHSMNLSFKNEEEVLLDNKNVMDEIRSETCGQAASKIAVIPEIREALLEKQRSFAKPPGLVTDGRDMGTVVFPDAILKIYLTASSEERAIRRYLQLKDRGIDASLAEVVKELALRDARDTNRAHSPLKPAEDAVLVDTTGLTIVQVFDNVLKLVDGRLCFR